MDQVVFQTVYRGRQSAWHHMAYAGEDVGVLAQEVGQQMREQSEALSQRIAAFTRHLRR
jgi:4-alpha-glucanotransferase